MFRRKDTSEPLVLRYHGSLSASPTLPTFSPLHSFVCPKNVIGPRYSFRSQVSSGSIVSDYGLDDREIGVRFPAEAKDFSCSFCVQTGSGAHSASCAMGTGGPFPGGKARPGREADHSPPSSAEVENE
jgi:hypothetical protein